MSNLFKQLIYFNKINSYSIKYRLYIYEFCLLMNLVKKNTEKYYVLNRIYENKHNNTVFW
jgi:hypothetical protein